MDFDVAIVGAGAAGIAAARRLYDAGRAVVLLEAAPRVGGRAWTVTVAGMPFDLGCGWLHSADRNPLVHIGETAGFAVDRTPSAWRTQWRDLGFSSGDREAAGAAWDALEQRLRSDPPSSDRASDALPEKGRWNAYCQALSGFMNGAPLTALSIADFLAYERAASETNWRVPNGYGALFAALVPPVAVRLKCPVNRISVNGRHPRLETVQGPLTVGAVIVTASTNLLVSGAIAFDETVGDHLQAAAQLPLGLAEKVYLELVGDHGLQPDTHLLGNPFAAETGSYYIRPLGRPVIEGFFGGLGVAQFGAEGMKSAAQFAIDELAGLLGGSIRAHLRPLVASDWQHRGWVLGSYSHALPGHAAARATLAAPVDGRLIFAGEATHASDFSTAHGAWETGERAADTLLAA